MSQNVRILDKDIFAYTTFNRPWMNNAWLFDVLAYNISNLGFFWLIFCQVVMAFLCFYMLYKLLDALGVDRTTALLILIL